METFISYKLYIGEKSVDVTCLALPAVWIFKKQ